MISFADFIENNLNYYFHEKILRLSLGRFINYFDFYKCSIIILNGRNARQTKSRNFEYYHMDLKVDLKLCYYNY